MGRKATMEERGKFADRSATLYQMFKQGKRPADSVLEGLQRLIEGRFEKPFVVPDWYVNPEQQLENVRRWNEEREWGFTDKDFPEIPVGLEPRSPLCVPVLAVYLPDQGKRSSKVSGIIRTASNLWEIARKLQPNSQRLSQLEFDIDWLGLWPGTEKSHTPGIRWCRLNVGANWDGKTGVAPWEVRSKDSAHAEILAAAAHFPGWVQAMNGIDVPYVWLPGYEVLLPRRSCVPFLYWLSDERTIKLRAYWSGNNYHSFAVPVREEL